MQCTGTGAPAARLRSGFRGGVALLVISGALLARLLYVAPGWAQSQSEDNGEKIFMQNSCFVCHGQQGFGGIGPAFRNNPFLKLTDYVAGQIILGRAVMPPFGDKLDDKQIAAVASYIRNSWGNHFGPVKPEEVTQVRHELGTAAQQATDPSSQTTGNSPRTTGDAPKSK